MHSPGDQGEVRNVLDTQAFTAAVPSTWTNTNPFTSESEYILQSQLEGASAQGRLPETLLTWLGTVTAPQGAQGPHAAPIRALGIISSYLPL